MNRRSRLSVLAFYFALFLMSTSPVCAATVLFDQGHGQMFTIDAEGPLQLSQLASLFQKTGSKVRASDTPLTPDQLSGVDVLVCSGPFRPFTQEEIETVLSFVERGGRLLLMLHIAPPAGDLLHALGLDFANGVVREQDQIIDNNPLDFYVSDLTGHPVTEGLERFAIYGSWVLRVDTATAEVLAYTGPRAWVDLNRDEKLGVEDAVQPFAVAVVGTRGKGSFLVFGDDAVFQNRFLVKENLTLAKKMVDWVLRP